MNAMRGLSMIVVVAGLGVASNSMHAEEAPVDEAAVRDRVATELRCLDATRERLDEAVRLLRDAHAQMGSSRGAAVRRDAAQAAETLEKRIRELSGELNRCMADAPQPQRQAAVEPSPDPTEQAVSERNVATLVVDRERRLGSHLAVKVGQQVDGTGRVPEQAVKDAITGIARPLQRCYQRLVTRGALERGTLTLVFRITPRGRVSRVVVEESSLGGRAFSRCVKRVAMRHLRVASPATGGNADYSYELRFGGAQE